MRTISWTRRPACYALAALLVAAAWQWLTVRYNYGGNWTGLFCTGSTLPVPAALAGEHIYVFSGTPGYDGQSYHYIAHDPFLKRGFQQSLDAPQFRYRRILVSLLAWLVAGGQDRFVDRAYLAVIWCFVFAGALWTGLIVLNRGAHPAWALAFLFLPAVSISLDRLTIDVALAALVAGVVYYLDRRNWTAVALLCALACLARESGLLVSAALALWSVMERRWRRAALLAVSIVPALAWYLYVASHARSWAPGDLLSAIPFAGLLYRLVHPIHYPFGFAVNALATVLDYAALAGVIAAIAYCGIEWRRLSRQPDGLVAFAFVALIACVWSQDVWGHAYGYARAFSPLLLLAGLDGFRSRLAMAALPLALAAPRIGLEMGSQILRVVRGVLGV